MTAGHDSANPRIRWDGTVNIPTLLMLLATIASCVGFGMTIYNNLSRRIDSNTDSITLIKHAVANNKEQQQQAQQNMTYQLRDNSKKLDALLWDRGDRAKGSSNNPGAPGWTKK